MIGTRTGMILDYSMKSRTCRICLTDRRINKIPNVKKKKKNKIPKVHVIDRISVEVSKQWNLTWLY